MVTPQFVSSISSMGTQALQEFIRRNHLRVHSFSFIIHHTSLFICLLNSILIQTTAALARLEESKDDELAKLRDAKATILAIVNSLNEQLVKAEAKRKEDVDLIQGQLESIKTSHRTLMARKEAELERKNQQIHDLEPLKQ